MKKWKKLSAVVMCIVMNAVSFNMSAQASVLGKDGSTDKDFVWVPTVTNVEDMDFTSSDEDVTITKNAEDNSVSFSFKSDAADAEARKTTEVQLDTSKVHGKYHYVSFDLSISEYMDFVATMDLPQADTFRPYSLYVGQHISSGKVYSKAGAVQHDPDKSFVKDGDLVGELSWLTAETVGGVGLEVNQVINVKMLSEAGFSYNNANIEQPVYIYINGVRGGQTVGSMDITSSNQIYNFDTVRFIHYATEEATETVTLKNLQMGYAKTEEEYVTKECGKSDTLYFDGWTTKAGKDFIRVTINNPHNYPWVIYPNKITTANMSEETAKEERVQVIYGTDKNGKAYGSVVSSRQLMDIAWAKPTGFMARYEYIEDNQCVKFWDGAKIKSWLGDPTEKVVVTFILDYDNKTLTAECNGLSETTSLDHKDGWLSLNDSNKVMKLCYYDGTSNKWDGAIAEKIEYGRFITPKGLNISDTLGRTLGDTTSIKNLGITAFGNADTSTVKLFIAEYSSDNRLLSTQIKDIPVENGIYNFAPNGTENQIVRSDEAGYMKAFLIEDMAKFNPLQTADRIDFVAAN